MPLNRRRLSPWLRIALLLLGHAAAAPAFACTVSATSFQFGAIDPLVASPTDSSSTITVDCPSLTAYTIALSAGNGSYAERQMQSGANSLAYNLYTAATYTNIWGDGTGGSSTVAGSADASGTEHSVFGRVPHQATATPGTYSDSIVVTITF